MTNRNRDADDESEVIHHTFAPSERGPSPHANDESVYQDEAQNNGSGGQTTAASYPTEYEPFGDDDLPPIETIIQSGSSEKYYDDQRSEERDFGEEEIKVLPGNYLFTVGPTGAGKSTFQSVLVRHLFSSPAHTTSRVDKGDASTGEADALMNSWVHSWETNEFPRRTRIGRPTVVRLNVENNEFAHCKPLECSILEVSGEDYQHLIHSDTDDFFLPPVLEKFLAHPGVNIVFVFVCNGQDTRNADRLFLAFLQHINRRYGQTRNFRQRTSAAVLVNNPMAAALTSANDKLRKQGKPPLTSPPRQLDLKEFVAAYLPLTVGQLRGWKRRCQVGAFHIGQVRRAKKLIKLPNGATEDQVVEVMSKLDYSDSQKMYNWIYKQFTGKALGPSWISRLKDD